MQKKTCLFCLFALMLVTTIAWGDDAHSRNLDVIRYGTDGEILDLIGRLKTAGEHGLDGELAALAGPHTNRKIMEVLYDYFTPLAADVTDSENSKEWEEAFLILDATALEHLEYWDQYPDALLDLAIRYCAARTLEGASSLLLDFLNEGQEQHYPALLRALGHIGKTGTAQALIGWWQKEAVPERFANDFYRALGNTRQAEAVPFIKETLAEDALGPTAKIALLQAAEKLAHEDLLKSILVFLQDEDANVRASLIEALSAYQGEEVEQLILSSFRDSFYRVRIAAARAAGQRKLVAALPYLIFRAERDSVPQVQLAAVQALAKLEQEEAYASLRKILGEERRGDALRAAAAKALLEFDSAAEAAAVVEQLKKSYIGTRQSPVYHLFARLLSKTVFPGAFELARELLSGKEVTDRHYGLDLAQTNELTALLPQIELLDTGKTDSLSIKARRIREYLEGRARD